MARECVEASAGVNGPRRCVGCFVSAMRPSSTPRRRHDEASPSLLRLAGSMGHSIRLRYAVRAAASTLLGWILRTRRPERQRGDNAFCRNSTSPRRRHDCAPVVFCGAARDPSRRLQSGVYRGASLATAGDVDESGVPRPRRVSRERASTMGRYRCDLPHARAVRARAQLLRTVAMTKLRWLPCSGALVAALLVATEGPTSPVPAAR